MTFGFTFWQVFCLSTLVLVGNTKPVQRYTPEKKNESSFSLSLLIDRSLPPQGIFGHLESPQDDGRPAAVFRHSGQKEGQSGHVLFETWTVVFWIRRFTHLCVNDRVCWRTAISIALSISSNPTSSTTCPTTPETRPSSAGGTSTSSSSGSCGRLRYLREGRTIPRPFS